MTDSDRSDYPQEYNDFVEFIRVNHTSVTAQVMSRNYVPIGVLEELVEEWRDLNADNTMKRAIEIKNKRHQLSCADELEEIIDSYGKDNGQDD